MKAELLFHQRIDYGDGAIVEMVLWRVPTAAPPSTHGLKYRLFYGRPAFAKLAMTMNGAREITGIFAVTNLPTGSLPSNS
jgi:hypothetical protein